MPRSRRILPDHCVQHVINRGNKREDVFLETADYEDFLCLLADTMERVPMRILNVALMKNHFHLVLWPTEGVLVSAYMDSLMNAQIRRLQKRHGTIGSGHIYQGRFRNFPVQGDAHLYRVLRYVEANPLRAGLVQRAEQYRWSSLSRRRTPDGRQYLSPWPVPRPENWIDYVNKGIDWRELDDLRTSTNRGTPFGDKLWVQTTAERYGLQSTLTPRGRPKIVGGAADTAAVPSF